MSDRYPRAFALMLILLAGTGSVAVAWALTQYEALSTVIAFAVATALLQTGQARIRDDVHSSLMMVGVFTAMIVGGAPLAVLSVVAVPVVVATQTAKRRVVKTIFNWGQLTASAATGGLVLGLFLTPGSLADLVSVAGIVGLAMAGVASTVTNHLLVALVVKLTTGERLNDSLHGVLGSALLVQTFYLGFAVVAAVLIVEVNPFTLVLLVVPAIVARRGLLGFQAQAEAYDRLVNAFVKVIEVKDPYTRGHADRVASLSEAVAGEMGYDYDTRRLVRYAAMLHDVGKVGIPVDVINKPGALDEEERELISRHPLVGAEMLRDITFLQPVIDIVRFHHERIDGRGYPYAIPGDDLSPLVRIVTAVDAFDAMTSTRSYRRALDVGEAVRELRRHAGTQFDPEVVEALARTVESLAWKPTLAFASERELASRAARLGGPATPVIDGPGIATAGAQA